MPDTCKFGSIDEFAAYASWYGIVYYCVYEDVPPAWLLGPLHAQLADYEKVLQLRVSENRGFLNGFDRRVRPPFIGAYTRSAFISRADSLEELNKLIASSRRFYGIREYQRVGDDVNAQVLLLSQPDAQFCIRTAESEALVADAEEVLDLRFPRTYRQFVLGFGGVCVANLIIYGVISDRCPELAWASTVDLTLRERQASGLPCSLVLISPAEGGSYYALDTATQSDGGECPVVIWKPGANNGLVSQPVAASFGEFLVNKVTELMKTRRWPGQID